jgi:CheY-like chemotaxis protein
MSNSSIFQRILVVEDDPLLRWSIAETVARDGHDVTTIADGPSALALLKRAAEFDVVLVSHPLPDADDFLVLEFCQHHMPVAATIFMSVYGEREDITRARQLGAAGVLTKPFDLTVLHRAVFDAAGV